jgi:alpha-galactosidase
VAEHPEYLLPSSTIHRYDIVDYSEEEVMQFMLDYIGDILEDAGAEWLRVDFTGSLGEKWKLKDATLGDNRVGITEINYVTNLYRLYDGLKERIPGLMIDNCASGGRRIDLETATRAVNLWRSDTGCFPEHENFATSVWNNLQTLSLNRY